MKDRLIHFLGGYTEEEFKQCQRDKESGIMRVKIAYYNRLNIFIEACIRILTLKIPTEDKTLEIFKEIHKLKVY